MLIVDASERRLIENGLHNLISSNRLHNRHLVVREESAYTLSRSWSAVVVIIDDILTEASDARHPVSLTELYEFGVRREARLSRLSEYFKGCVVQVVHALSPEDILIRIMEGEFRSYYYVYSISWCRRALRLGRRREASDYLAELQCAYDQVSRHVSLIDPAWIDEYRLSATELGIVADARWPITCVPILRKLLPIEMGQSPHLLGINITEGQLGTLNDSLRRWVLSRDHRLIAQSSGLIVYRPFHLMGGARLSRGVLSELITFGSMELPAGKAPTCIIVHPHEDRGFVDDPIMTISSTIAEAGFAEIGRRVAEVAEVYESVKEAECVLTHCPS